MFLRLSCEAVPQNKKLYKVGRRDLVMKVNYKSWIILAIFVLLMVVVLLSKQFNGTGYPVMSEKCEECLVVYNLEEYLDQEVLSDFEKETGNKVQLVQFSAIDRLIAEFERDPSYPDLLIVDDFTLTLLKEKSLLLRLDHSNIPNAGNIDPKFLNLYFDPQNEFSMPYLWGTTGIAYNSRFVDKVDSWSVLWDGRYSGKMALISDSREIASLALQKLGYSANSQNPEELSEAIKDLENVKADVVLPSLEISSALVGNELYVAHCYNGEAYAAKLAKPDIMYVLPKEGGTFWIDNMVVSRYSGNREAAQEFMDFMLKPDVNAKNANTLKYASPLSMNKVEGYLDPSLMNDPIIYPSQETMSKMELNRPFEVGSMYEQILEDYILKKKSSFSITTSI